MGEKRSNTTGSNFHNNFDPQPTNSQDANCQMSQKPLQASGELHQVNKSIRCIKACLIGMTALIILILALTIFALAFPKFIAIYCEESGDKISLMANLSMKCHNGGSLVTITGGLIFKFLFTGGQGQKSQRGVRSHFLRGV